MKGFRRDRTAEQIRRELISILETEAGDERPEGVYLSKVELSPDYGYARILVTPAVVGETLDEKETVRPLKKLAPQLRNALARRLKLRRIPELDFRLDKGKLNEERIETLLARIKKRSKDPGPAALLLLMFFAPALTAERPEPTRFEAEAQAMGTSFRIAAYGPEKRKLASVVFAAFDEARRIDALISNYQPESELSRVNAEAAERSVAISREFGELLAVSLEASEASDGAFDLTVGPLMKVWGFYKGKGALPSEREVRRAVARVGAEQVVLSPDRRSVRFSGSGVELDPGGIGKGYAVDRMVALLRRYGIESAMISAGTSTLYALGAPPDEPLGWRVELRSPDEPDAVAETVYLRDESLSTSGSYEKFFEVEGRRYCHIMDPRTGRPVEGTAAVSVRSASALESEIWTTALFVLGKEEVRRSAPAGAAVFFCPTEDACAWIEGSPSD